MCVTPELRTVRTARRAALALTLFFAALAGGDNADDLAALRARIAQIQQSLDQARSERDSVRGALGEVEREIGIALAGIRQLDRELRTGTRELDRLRRQQGEKQAQSNRLRQEIAEHARLAYMLGGQESLKLLLNQEDPAQASRMLAYHRYFAQARARRIADLASTTRELAALLPELDSRTTRLASIREARLRDLRALEQSRARERELLKQLGRRVESRAQQVTRLRADEARLSRLVNEVQASLTVVPPLSPGGRFAEAKGRLAFPVKGRVASTTGARDLKWRGVLLQARPGQDMHSVFPGRVVYADWLQGIGLLLIVEHGEGYMTLYGHGQTLYKKVGDRVEAGEVIGQTGKTGSFTNPGVYFEIRHNGQPHNPLEWCRRTS